jgi:hypothetical protein
MISNIKKKEVIKRFEQKTTKTKTTHSFIHSLKFINYYYCLFIIV